MLNNPSFSLNTSETTFQAHSKNTSGCTKKVKPHPKDSFSFQQSQNSSEPLAERLNLSNQAEKVGPGSILLHNLPAQMRETSLNDQSSQSFQLNNYISFEGLSIYLKNEEEKSKENLEALPESFNDESEYFEKQRSHHDRNAESSIKSNVDKNTADNLSDIPIDEENGFEAEDDEKVKLKETTEMIENSKGPVLQFIKKLDDLKSQVLDGKLLEAYNGFIPTKQENPVYFKKGHKNFFSAKFYETLILFLCCHYNEALPGLLDMEECYEANEDYVKMEIDEKDETLKDIDFGVLYHKIGKCQSELNNPQEGIKYLEKALLKLEKSRADNPKKQPFLLMNCQSSLTQHYLKYGRGEKAKEHSEKALEYAKELTYQEWGMAPIKQSMARCFINCCDVETFMGNQEKAQEDLDKAKEFLLESLNGFALESHHMGARIKRSQAQIHWKKKEYDSAIKLYEDAIDIIDNTMPQNNKLKEDYLDELQKLKEEKEKSSKN